MIAHVGGVPFEELLALAFGGGPLCLVLIARLTHRTRRVR